jgi:hypothetical protein
MDPAAPIIHLITKKLNFEIEDTNNYFNTHYSELIKDY